MKNIKGWEMFTESNNNLNTITNSILTQIEWGKHNNSKSDWEDFGANGCMSVDDMDDIVYKLKESPTDEIILILKEVLDNYDTDYSESVVNMLISRLEDLEDFDEILNSDDRFDY